MIMDIMVANQNMNILFAKPLHEQDGTINAIVQSVQLEFCPVMEPVSELNNAINIFELTNPIKKLNQLSTQFLTVSTFTKMKISYYDILSHSNHHSMPLSSVSGLSRIDASSLSSHSLSSAR